MIVRNLSEYEALQATLTRLHIEIGQDWHLEGNGPERYANLAVRPDSALPPGIVVVVFD